MNNSENPPDTMDKWYERLVDGLKEPPLPPSQEGLGQQTSPNEGHAKRKWAPGHKGSPLPGQMWKELLGIQVAWGGRSGQPASQLDRKADGLGKMQRGTSASLTCPPGGGQSTLGELL